MGPQGLSFQIRSQSGRFQVNVLLAAAAVVGGSSQKPALITASKSTQQDGVPLTKDAEPLVQGKALLPTRC